ncbi:MAG: 3-keto-5-aminohexanoate cleavage enzyme [Pseudonocardiales bacterium]|jgi:3-keto-5-aminohexanoate cleavage enzyme|nr:3-keto-5-aminohexanoate cleavage enzyme [Pseudonocardiales bacterium]
MNPAVLTTALTGPLATKADNAALPTTPEEIAAAAKDAYDAGAAVVHVHLRDADQRPTADLDIARRVVGLIEEACPALVQLSTGVGLGVGIAERSKLVEVKPRMATLNVCSMTFGNGEFSNPPDDVRRLANRMGELGVKPELELYDAGHLEMALALHGEGLLREPLQFSLVMGVLGGMPATPATLVSLIDRMPAGSVWQVIGIGRHNLAMTAIGLAMGGNARTGMEDTLMVRRGQPTTGNGELTERLAVTANALDRPSATVDQAIERLQLGHSVSKSGQTA